MDLHTVRRIELLADYQVIKRVQSGAQASMFKGVSRRSSQPVAIKIYNLKERPDIEFEQETIAIVKAQTIPGVVRLFDAGIEGSYGVLVVEWCSGGSIDSMKHEKRTYFTESIVGFMLRTLKGLHDLGITHGDIKTENILQRSVPSGGEHFCLCDFGLCRIEEPAEGRLVGTLDYLAPELLEVPPLATTRRIDTWMLGILTYELITGVPPFMAESISQTKYLICTAEPVLNRPEIEAVAGLAEFLSACLQKNPQKRPTVAELIDKSKELTFVAACLARKVCNPSNRVVPAEDYWSPRKSSVSLGGYSVDAVLKSSEVSANSN